MSLLFFEGAVLFSYFFISCVSFVSYLQVSSAQPGRNTPHFLRMISFPLLIPKTPNSIAVLIDQCMIVIEKRISSSRSQTGHTAVSLLSLSLESNLDPELLVVLVKPSPVLSF
jgi:hypothetical protein